jgi:ABC-type microcin C transport system permease subunit YejB
MTTIELDPLLDFGFAFLKSTWGVTLLLQEFGPVSVTLFFGVAALTRKNSISQGIRAAQGRGNKVVNVTVSVSKMPAAVGALILEEISNPFFVLFFWFGIDQEPQTSSH